MFAKSKETVTVYVDSMIHVNRTILHLNVGHISGESSKTSPMPRTLLRTGKDQELNSAGTELKIRFVIVTTIEITYGSNQNAKFHIKNLCPHIHKIAPIMVQVMA